MYTKSPLVLVEISSYSFGHFGWSDLREKSWTAENCSTMSVKLQLASHGGFGKTLKASVFGEKTKMSLLMTCDGLICIS